MCRLRTSAFLLLLLALMLQAAPLTLVQTGTARAVAASSNAARKAAEQITAEQLKDYLYFVASDEMEGRDTPSRGLDLTTNL